MALFLIQHVVVIGGQDIFEMLGRDEILVCVSGAGTADSSGGIDMDSVVPNRPETTGSGLVAAEMGALGSPWGLIIYVTGSG